MTKGAEAKRREACILREWIFSVSVGFAGLGGISGAGFSVGSHSTLVSVLSYSSFLVPTHNTTTFLFFNHSLSNFIFF